MRTQDALLAEVLGDVYKLRADVDALNALIPQARETLERASDYFALKVSEQRTQVDLMLTERIDQMAYAVKDFSAVREILVGALALRTSEHVRAEIVGVLREVLSESRVKGLRRYREWAYVALCSAVVPCALMTWLVYESTCR